MLKLHRSSSHLKLKLVISMRENIIWEDLLQTWASTDLLLRRLVKLESSMFGERHLNSTCLLVSLPTRAKSWQQPGKCVNPRPKHQQGLCFIPAPRMCPMAIFVVQIGCKGGKDHTQRVHNMLHLWAVYFNNTAVQSQQHLRIKYQPLSLPARVSSCNV